MNGRGSGPSSFHLAFLPRGEFSPNPFAGERDQFFLRSVFPIHHHIEARLSIATKRVLPTFNEVLTPFSMIAASDRLRAKWFNVERLHIPSTPYSQALGMRQI